MIRLVRFYFRIALQNLILHKARMVLALLGILFAVMSLFAFGNISGGMKIKIDEEIGRFGKNLLIVRAGLVFATGRGTRQFGESQTLKLNDARQIREGLKGVKDVAPFFDVTYPARYQEKSLKVSLVGAPDNIFLMRNAPLFLGKYYGKDEEEKAEKKIVVGYKIFTNLFESTDPIGKYIFVFRAPSEIIGVLEERVVDFTGQDQDIQAFVPLRTFMRRYSNVDYIKGIYVQVEDEIPLAEMKPKLRQFIRRIHKLQESQKDDFSIFSMEDILKTREEGIRLVSTLTIIASTISFIIGGLGIFAIMLLSVSERKMEIGIRRVVGSRKRDIVVQFLVESAVTALIGGFFGVVFGLIVTVVVIFIGDFAFTISFWNLMISLLASVLVGVAAGVYPALQSTKYEPIKALYS